MPAASPLTEPVPGGEIQREMALRFGINLVMYALTGNYKTDQVHAPALLERLGTEMTRLAFASAYSAAAADRRWRVIAAADHGLSAFARGARGAWARGLAFAILLFALAGPCW